MPQHHSGSSYSDSCHQWIFSEAMQESLSLQRHDLFCLFYICKILHLTISKYSLPKEVDWTNDSSFVYLTILSSRLGQRTSSTDFYCQFFYRYFQTSVEMLNSIMPITDSHRSSLGKPSLEQD